MIPKSKAVRAVSIAESMNKNGWKTGMFYFFSSQNLHQRLSTPGERILHLRRNLRILVADDQRQRVGKSGVLKIGIFPMPVLMGVTYNEDGSVNVMNAAWGTMQERDTVVLNLTETHKTVQKLICPR